MGMSASQARLLTLTARLNHNEFRAQQISNAKIRFSESAERVSSEYVEALSDTNLIYTTYDDTGYQSTQKLTGAAIYTYSSLKNQYGLVNAAGQLLVSELDGNNFEESDNLQEFLDKYGLLGDLDSAATIQVRNPEYTEAYNDYIEKYAKWKAEEPDKNDEIYWTEEEETVTTESDLYKQFVEGTAGGCYTTFMDPCGSGYLAVVHACDVLEHMLELGEHTTTSGETFVIISNGNDYESHWWREGSQRESINNVGGSPSIMAQIREAIKGMNACGKEHQEEDGEHIMDCPTSWGGCGSSHEMDCTTQTPCDGSQSLVDKIEDLYYEYKKIIEARGKSRLDLSNPDEQDLYNRMVHLVYHDLREVLSTTETKEVFDEDKYNEDHEKWESEEPQMEEVPEYVEKKVRTITDSDKGQWYINLWHRMNGESDYKAGYMQDDDYNADEDGWVTDSKTGQSYAILEDGLMNDSEWLEFALKNGVITMEQAQYTSVSEGGTGLKNVAWTSIVYSSMVEMSEESNDKDRTKAEVIYESKQREIEAKDKQYDNDLKQLDTEHDALQTEYESIQNVINKNVERTFKTFS